MVSKKTIRLYYWLVLEFFKKHLKYILLSFLLSLVTIFVIISLSPFIQSYIFTKHDVIGMAGQYDINNLPDDITFKISNGLIFINDKGELVPSLASSWQFDNTGRKYTFKLRDNLVWNDGQEFTAYDINYKFVDVQSKVVDKNTITFFLKNALPVFPTYLKKPILKYPLVGIAGVYKVESMRMEYGNIKELTLAPNKKGLHTLVYKFYDDEGQVITAYKRGEINEMQISKSSAAQDFGKWKNSTVERNVDYSRLMTLFFNMNNPIWKDAKDKEVRQAIRNLINPEKFKDMGVEAVGSINPLSWAYDEDLKRNVYDPESAEKLLKKLNIATSSATFNFNTSYDNFAAADEIVTSFQKVGLKINQNFVSSASDTDFDFLLAYWKTPVDPDQYYFWHQKQRGKGNITGYNRPKIDKLLEDGRKTTSVDERKKIYLEFEKTLLDDPPAVFLFYPYIYTVTRK